MMNPYVSLAVQTTVGGVIMYLVMFVMIDSVDSFYNNLNFLYMTLMMVTPMVVLMILAMRHMFPSKALNAALLAPKGPVSKDAPGRVMARSSRLVADAPRTSA
jgi:hypothetical protein